MWFPLLGHPRAGFEDAGQRANNKSEDVCYGTEMFKRKLENPKSLQENLGLMGHREGINVITGLEMQFATTGKNMAIKKAGKKT